MIPMDSRAYISASSNFFSGESEAKRRRLEVEERRLSLDEKAQVVQMVSVGVYTPRTARRKIEEIDQRMKPPAPETETVPSSQMWLSRSPLGSRGEHGTRSPSLDRRSVSWDIEDPEKLLDDGEEEI